jgi:hypothetical protein
VSRRPTFRASDMIRALKGAQAAGMRVAEVEITREGSILLRPDSLPADGKARNASGYVEAKIATAPWLKSK